MNDIVERYYVRVVLLEQFNPFFQVRTAIAYRSDWNTVLLGELLKLGVNDPSIRGASTDCMVEEKNPIRSNLVISLN